MTSESSAEKVTGASSLKSSTESLSATGVSALLANVSVAVGVSVVSALMARLSTVVATESISGEVGSVSSKRVVSADRSATTVSSCSVGDGVATGDSVRRTCVAHDTTATPTQSRRSSRKSERGTMTELDMCYNNASWLVMIHQPLAKVLNSDVQRHTAHRLPHG